MSGTFTCGAEQSCHFRCIVHSNCGIGGFDKLRILKVRKSLLGVTFQRQEGEEESPTLGLPFRDKKVRLCQRQKFGGAEADVVAPGKSPGLSSVCLKSLIPDQKT